MFKNKFILATVLFHLFFTSLPATFAAETEPDKTATSIATPLPSIAQIALTEQEKLWIKEHPTITVSNEFDWPPFDFALSGKPYGFGIDLMNLLSETSGIQFEYINGYTWDQLVNKYQRGEIDLLHCLSITPEREKTSHFSPPFYHSKNVLILRNDSPLTHNLNDLEGKIIALPRGWSSIEFFKKYYPGIHIVEVASSRQALEYVDQGKVYATVEQKEIAQYFMSKFGFYDLKLSEWIEDVELQKTSSMHFAVLKTNPILFQILAKAHNSIPPQTLESLKLKWFSRDGRAVGKADVGLTPDEKIFLSEHYSINYCITPEAMPFADIKNSQVSGMATDMFDLFSEKLNISFNLVPTTTWQESQEKFKKGECDIIPMITMNEQLDRQTNVTSPILKFQTAIITREEEGFIAGLQHFVGKKLAVVQYDLNENNISSLYPHISVLPYDNAQECLLHVSNKTSDGALLALPVAAHYIRHLGLTNLKIAGYSGSEGTIRIRSQKDRPYLNSIMSKLIRSIPQDDIDSVYQKWMSIRFDTKFDYTALWKFFSIFSIIVLLILLWNRQLFHLNKKIAEANKKLQEQSKELQRISITDVLTGLYNRRYSDIKLEEEIRRATRYKGNLSLIIGDLDFFKEVNDTWGHQIGDTVLQAFATILTEKTRDSDVVSRWGGEEFLIICPETDIQGALAEAENLRQAFSKISFKDVGKRTASFGVACYFPGESKSSFIQRADEALYRAKNNGRNRVESAK
ncbi:transporter substrate-binding domain-containing diguanylate cyclase [Desulforhopalus sp. 52FAK]